MANEKIIIDICSSDEEDEDVEKVIIDLCNSDEEEEDVFGYENIYGETEEEDDDTSSSGDDSDWNLDDAMESSDVEETPEKGDDDDVDDKVTCLLTAGSDLKSLHVNECKAYLRKHGLRLSGTKAVCIDRIVEHWRIKDGRGEAVYPRSSFAINCKGDVCEGDIVLFTQKVHHKCGKMKKSEKILGKRTVAGKVVHESYGTAKQQHTFTIEVLWCVGTQKLPTMHPLLVKGRNLYRLMTLRQRWANEDDRVKVLSEKHSRGAAARKIMRERKIKLGYVWKDGRLQKPGNIKKICQVKTRKNEKDENLTQSSKQNIPATQSLAAFQNQNPSHGQMNPSRSYAPRLHAPRPYGPFNVPNSHLPRPNIPPYHSCTYLTQQNQTNQRPPPAFYNRGPAFNALQRQVSINPHAKTHARPVTHQRRPYQNHHTQHASSNSVYDLGAWDLAMMVSHGREGDTYRQGAVTRRPYMNHHTYHSNYNSGYNHGVRVSHRKEDTYKPNFR